MIIERLQKHSGLTRSQLDRLANTASRRYKIYRIEKRTGGHRIIAHPSRQLKAVQRWLIKALFQDFPVHPNATAYKKGASIRENALRHSNSIFTLRLDFQKFFPSFTDRNIAAFLNSKTDIHQLELSENDIDFVCRIVTRNDQLTIGSPSSPIITNVMMFDFDNEISELCAGLNLIYTRYADDLFISSRQPNALNNIADQIAEFARRYDHVTLKINRRKTAYLSKRYRRSITGLIITPTNQISIGRGRKREIKSLINSFKFNGLESAELSRLQGLLAFTFDAEEDFFNSLRQKYGEEVLDQILRH